MAISTRKSKIPTTVENPQANSTMAFIFICGDSNTVFDVWKCKLATASTLGKIQVEIIRANMWTAINSTVIAENVTSNHCGTWKKKKCRKILACQTQFTRLQKSRKKSGNSHHWTTTVSHAFWTLWGSFLKIEILWISIYSIVIYSINFIQPWLLVNSSR